MIITNIKPKIMTIKFLFSFYGSVRNSRLRLLPRSEHDLWYVLFPALITRFLSSQLMICSISSFFLALISLVNDSANCAQLDITVIASVADFLLILLEIAPLPRRKHELCYSLIAPLVKLVVVRILCSFVLDQFGS